MILSASRRTDIPAFYSDWFLRRVREGFILVRNPMNKNMVSRISLDPQVIDCVVFWTKNARPLMQRLPEVRAAYRENFYFQYTLTAYDASVEPKVPRKASLIETFKELSDALGPERVVWRYDPIFFTREMDLDYHKKWFEELANRLGKYTRRCVISILDTYKKTERNMDGLGVRVPSDAEIRELLKHFTQVAANWSLPVESCSEAVDYSSTGVCHGKCIDDRLISKLRGMPFDGGKDKSQRPECGCVPSIDIGTYNTCLHGCRYCYANYSDNMVAKAHQDYDPDSPMLCDKLRHADEIKERPMTSFFTAQEALW